MTPPRDISDARAIPPGAITRQWHEVEAGMLFKVIVSSDDTHGAYAIMESIAQPGVGSITHMHHREDEHFLVLEGTGHIVLDGKPMDLHPGQSVTLPRGVPHVWINRSDRPLRMLALFTPGGFDKLCLEIASPGGIDHTQIQPRYGLEALGPKLEMTPQSQ